MPARHALWQSELDSAVFASVERERMNTGAAIMIVGGFSVWLWGMYMPGMNLTILSACIGGAAMVGFGLARIR
jgi:hypothetical protein